MTSCYLCGSPSLVERKGTVRDKPSLKILECSRCGLVSLASKDHIDDSHYERGGTHVSDPASAEHATMDSWLRFSSDDDRRRFESLRTVISNRRVLDFGCGAGGFLSLAAGVASSVAGIELEQRVREHWKGQIDIRGSLADTPGDFDVITAFHVVEHLPDPRGMLRDLGARLAQGGRMVVEVPSAADALITLYDSEAFQRFTYWSEHLHLFTASTMKTMAEQAGLRVVAIQQLQRYPLSNHLHWLSRGRPGGHRVWSFLDTPELSAAYASALAAHGISDTIVAHLEPG